MQSQQQVLSINEIIYLFQTEEDEEKRLKLWFKHAFLKHFYSDQPIIIGDDIRHRITYDKNNQPIHSDDKKPISRNLTTNELFNAFLFNLSNKISSDIWNNNLSLRTIFYENLLPFETIINNCFHIFSSKQSEIATCIWVENKTFRNWFCGDITIGCDQSGREINYTIPDTQLLNHFILLLDTNKSSLASDMCKRNERLKFIVRSQPKDLCVALFVKILEQSVNNASLLKECLTWIKNEKVICELLLKINGSKLSHFIGFLNFQLQLLKKNNIKKPVISKDYPLVQPFISEINKGKTEDKEDVIPNNKRKADEEEDVITNKKSKVEENKVKASMMGFI